MGRGGAVLAALVAVLGATELLGVTKIRARVNRLFAPEGPPIVEKNEPVKPEPSPAPPVANVEKNAFVLLAPTEKLMLN